MNQITNWTSNFFKRNFKKKFLLFIAVPFLVSTAYITDFLLLPEIKKTEKISAFVLITLPQSAGGTSVQRPKNMGFKYITSNGFKFSTMRTRIENPDLEIYVTPLFQTVKRVFSEKKKIQIESGLNGVNGLLMISGNLIMLIAIGYVLFVKAISENARLNLIFLHVCLFGLWIVVIVKYNV